MFEMLDGGKHPLKSQEMSKKGPDSSPFLPWPQLGEGTLSRALHKTWGSSHNVPIHSLRGLGGLVLWNCVLGVGSQHLIPEHYGPGEPVARLSASTKLQMYFKFFSLFLFYALFSCMSVHHSLCSAREGQKNSLDPLELGHKLPCEC